MYLDRLTTAELLNLADLQVHELTTTAMETALARHLAELVEETAGNAPLIEMLDDHGTTEPEELETLLSQAARLKELLAGHDGLMDFDDAEAALHAIDGFTPKALVKTLAFADSVERLLETYEIADVEALEQALQAWADTRQTVIHS